MPDAPAWSYEDALAWLYARQRLGIKLGLAKVERLLDALGNPQDAYRSIHVAGTNGKGSVTRMLAESLRQAGHRVGCTTSPHLVSFTERIEVDGQPIPKTAVAAGLAQLRTVTEELDAAGEPPTFFELVTALAFLHFRDQAVTWAVVETGLGGRLDATNVLRPKLTVITNVDYDHMDKLGNTLPEIAFEKAGIMKPQTPCVTGCSGDALVVLKARSHELQVPMSILGEDYHVVPDPHELVLLRPNGEARFAVGLRGAHQKQNAALVVAAADALARMGHPIPPAALQRGLRLATNPGRLERFDASRADLAAPTTNLALHHNSQPQDDVVPILVDGAHNAAGADALRGYLFDEGWSGYDLVCGFLGDKAWESTLDPLLFAARRLWAVPVRNPRSLDPAHAAEAGTAAGVRSAQADDLRSALRAAAQDGATRIVVAGSLFLAGEALAVLRGQSLEEIRGSQ